MAGLVNKKQMLSIVHEKREDVSTKKWDQPPAYRQDPMISCVTMGLPAYLARSSHAKHCPDHL